MTTRGCAALAALFAICVAASVRADENTGFYAGGSLGYAKLEASEDFEFGEVDDEFEIDAEDFAWKAFVGYQFLPWLAIEGGYVDLGTASESFQGVNLDADVDGWDAFLVGNLPLGIVDVFAKVGAISWNVDVDLDVGDESFGIDDSGEDIAYGVGVAFDLNHFAIRGEVEMFDISDIDDLFMISLGATIQF